MTSGASEKSGFGGIQKRPQEQGKNLVLGGYRKDLRSKEKIWFWGDSI